MRPRLTGVAGPDGGTEEKPVGLVYLGCAGPRTRSTRVRFPGDRDTVRPFSPRVALHLLRQRCRRERRAGREAARLFVACDLPREVERAVRTWQHKELAPHEDLRVAPTLHLTLAFLGSLDAARLPDLERLLGGMPWSGAECRLKEPLFLPAPRGNGGSS